MDHFESITNTCKRNGNHQTLDLRFEAIVLSSCSLLLIDLDKFLPSFRVEAHLVLVRDQLLH